MSPIHGYQPPGSENSAAPLATAQATQFGQQAGEPVGSEFEIRQSAESTYHNPVSTSFSSHGRDEGKSSGNSICSLPPVPHKITPFGSQAIHPDPISRPLSVVGTSIDLKADLIGLFRGRISKR